MRFEIGRDWLAGKRRCGLEIGCVRETLTSDEVFYGTVMEMAPTLTVAPPDWACTVI